MVDEQTVYKMINNTSNEAKSSPNEQSYKHSVCNDCDKRAVDGDMYICSLDKEYVILKSTFNKARCTINKWTSS